MAEKKVVKAVAAKKEFDEKGNVLVLGNSGVGKSTLINSVLGEDVAKTSYGTEGTTKELAIYENDEVPFRLIDTVGFEPSFVKEQRAINAVKKWSKERAEEGNKDSAVNVIWFCVEGTSSKLFEKTIDTFIKATSIWKTVPVIAVITKSYSMPERKQNIEMVEKAFSQKKRFANNMPDIIPVVAQIYELTTEAFAPPEGIAELIDLTNEKLPEGIRAGKHDLAAFKLKRRRALAHGTVVTGVAAGTVVGLVKQLPKGVKANQILTATETAMIKAIAKVYDIPNDQVFQDFLQKVLASGGVAMIGQKVVQILKNIPPLKPAMAVIDSAVAAVIVAGLGEMSVYAFEKVYLGDKSLADAEWLKEIIAKFDPDEYAKKTKAILETVIKNGTLDKDAIVKLVVDNVLKKNKKNPA